MSSSHSTGSPRSHDRDGHASVGPIAAILGFFADLPEDDRTWLVLSCAFGIDDNFMAVKGGVDADLWLHRFLIAPPRPRVRCARLIYMVAILDFELSTSAIARLEARAQWMMATNNAWFRDQGRKMHENTIPRMKRIVSFWQEIRSRELDEAAIWVLRDEAQHQETTETGSPPGSLSWPPIAPP